MSDSGAPASTSAADTASVRGVAFGWANVAVSMTMPAISCAASGAIRRSSSGTPRRTREERHHLAGRRGAGIDPVGGRRSSSFEAWWSRTTRGSRSNSSAMPLADGARSGRACRSPRRRAGRSRRRGPDRCGTARCRAGSRRARGTGSAQTAGRPARRTRSTSAADREASRRACPRRGSRGRRPARVARPEPLDDGVGDGRRGPGREVDVIGAGVRGRDAVRLAGRAAVGGADAASARAGRRRTAGSLGRSPSWRQPRRPASAATRRPASVARGTRPASSSCEELEDAGAALGGVVELERGAPGCA